MKTEHTPTPWRLEDKNQMGAPRIFSKSIHVLTARYEQDAAFIVRAVNSYQQMYDTLAQVQAVLCNAELLPNLIETVNKAIAKAEGLENINK